ncbi:MAG: type II toxin-antitoxin system RelE/ParE family toxin [Verrucomicrobiales bacterium]|nr:type II toxin-antitoxin system RelE/ParE family toxin [Verrucomicrobiales bacterium]
MTPLRQSQQFEADFTARALHLSQANPSAALRFIDAVEAALDLLAQHPAMGPVWRYGNPQRPTRYLLVPGFRNYLIFYRYEGGEVALGRLMHGAQDLHDVLGD